jgi:hypothetical protein
MNRNVRTIKVDAVAIFLSVLPESLKNNNTLFVIFVLKQNQFTNTIKLSLTELTNIQISFRIVTVVVKVSAHTMHFIMIPVSYV